MAMTASAGEAASALRSGKSQAAFRTISEVADELDVAQHVLRFWESKFPQVRPLKRGGGRRYYRPEDIDLLRDIRSLLYDEGYTIKGAQKLLRQRRARPLAPPASKASGSIVADLEPSGGAAAADRGLLQHRLDAPPVSPAADGDTAARAAMSATAVPATPAAARSPQTHGTAAPAATAIWADQDIERLRRLRRQLSMLRDDLQALLAEADS